MKTFVELTRRGLIYQCTNSLMLETHLNKSRVVYAGFDPTASSLHVGNLLMLVALLHFQIGGHQPIALVGGATATIGDPSGKFKERQKIDVEILQSNQTKITHQIENLLKNSKEYAIRKGYQVKNDAMVLDNIDWYKKMPLLEFMDQVGRHARVNSMVP